MPSIEITSNNFSGQIGTITFLPATGGTVNVGSYTIPYTYTSDYIYGTYQVYFSAYSLTCNYSLPLPQFISRWSVDSLTITPYTICLAYTSGGTYSGTIDWGDGNISANTYANKCHTYSSSSATYTVTISGEITGWNFLSTEYAGFYNNSIIEVLQWGPLRGGYTSNERMFYNCINLSATNVSDIINLSNITSLESMFQGCISLTTVNGLNSWDVSSITNMGGMFNSSYNFNQSLSGWNVSNVTSMNSMFSSTINFNQNLGIWNISGVTDMTNMLDDSGISIQNYNDILIGWSNQNVKNGVTLGANNLTYSISVAGAQRNILTGSPYNWTIVGDIGAP